MFRRLTLNSLTPNISALCILTLCVLLIAVPGSAAATRIVALGDLHGDGPRIEVLLGRLHHRRSLGGLV